MNSKELLKLLMKYGCIVETHRGGSGHVTIIRGEKRTQLPMHGSRKELGKGLVKSILKDLDIQI